jgi:hypothetical protein
MKQPCLGSQSSCGVSSSLHSIVEDEEDELADPLMDQSAVEFIDALRDHITLEDEQDEAEDFGVEIDNILDSDDDESNDFDDEDPSSIILESRPFARSKSMDTVGAGRSTRPASKAMRSISGKTSKGDTMYDPMTCGK